MLLVVPMLGARAVARHARQQRSWLPVVGTVTHLRTETPLNRSDSATRTYLVATYEYRDHVGQQHTGEGRTGNQAISVAAGPQQIELRVDPACPSRSVVFDPYNAAKTGCAALFFVVFALIVITISVVATRAGGS